MAQMTGEPSLEQILASIKKVIAEDGQATRGLRRRAAPASKTPASNSPASNPSASNSLASKNDDVLELTDMLDEEQAYCDDPSDDDVPMVSAEKSRSMRESLEALATLSEPGAAPQIVRSGETSLESMIREMLRPMLAQWLDDNLPDMVEALVTREIGRIVGKRG